MNEDDLELSNSEEVRKNLESISKLLNTGLDAETIQICIDLIEAGVNSQALAEVVRILKST